MKKIVCIFLAILLCMGMCACSFLNPTIEGNGYDSPEEALLAYAEALKAGDADKILSTFAIETYVKNYDIEEYWDFMGAAYLNRILPRFPSTDAYTSDINLISRQYAITNNLSYMYLYFTLGEDLLHPIQFNGDPYDSPDELLDKIVIDDWMEILSEMEFDDDFVYLDDVLDNDDAVEKAEDNLERQCDFYGCDEIVTLALEIELDGDDYLLCVNAACYDGKWYNLECMGTIGNCMGYPANTGGLCLYE